MAEILYLVTGTPYMAVISDHDDADVTVPAVAGDLAKARAVVRANANFAGDAIPSVQALAYGERHILLIITEDDPRVAPTLLLFHPDLEDGQTAQDMLAADAEGEGGVQRWIKDGCLHRETGPALILEDGRQEWWREGRLPPSCPAAAVMRAGMRPFRPLSGQGGPP